jgi:ABC-type transport system involved in multi-copper enzyme maturation permease subunit
MIANVFQNDFLIAERRGRQHVLRWIYAGWLLMQAFFILYSDFFVNTIIQRRPPLWSIGAFHLFDVYVTQQMVLLLLLVPALAAGAVADEKTRGTLQHLFATEINSREFLLGKLLARTAQVCLLFLPGLPLIGFLGGLVGLDLATLLCLLVAQLIPVAALVAVTLLASVWCRQTRDAVITVYALGVAGYVLIRQIGGPLLYLDPLFVLAPLSGSDEYSDSLGIGQRLVGSIVAWGSIGGASLAAAIWRLRPAYHRQLEGTRFLGKRLRRAANHPPVGNNPVYWREQYVEGLSPTRALRFIPRWVVLLLIFGVSLYASVQILVADLASGNPQANIFELLYYQLSKPRSFTFSPDSGADFLGLAAAALFSSTVIVGIRCSGAIVGEREKQTWEALLVTPLTARELVRGKLWAVMGASYPYLAAYAIPAILCSALTFSIAVFYIVAGLAVTTLAMYYMGAMGLYFSVRSKTSWRSLFATLGLGYGAVSVVYSFAFPVVIVLMLIVSMLLMVIESAAGARVAGKPFNPVFPFAATMIAAGICFGFICWLLSRFLLNSTQNWIAKRDRVRRWDNLPPWASPSRRRLRPR